MPEKEAELSALENGETIAPEKAADDAAEETRADVRAEEPSGIRAEFDQLQAENDQLKKERDQLKDRLARLQAEFENARKRAEKEKADFKDFAIGSHSCNAIASSMQPNAHSSSARFDASSNRNQP